MHPCNRTCERFQEFSQCAAKAISEATQLGLLYQEETISENLLLAIARSCQNVKIKSFKRHEELKNGSDWEWWIRINKKWLPMRVQAKKKRTNGDTFQSLQTYRAKSAPTTQIDTLIKVAGADGLLPAYCFYVSEPNSSPNFLNPFGCWIASAGKTKQLSSNEWKVLQKISRPWHYLVCNCKCNVNSVPAILDLFSGVDEQDVSNFLKAALPD